MRTLLLVSLSLVLVSPARGAEAPEAPAPEVPRVTTSFSGADLIETLYHLFRDTGLRYEAPRDARETFSADLEDVPLEKALRVVLEPRGFTFTREGDLYRIEKREGHRSVGERLAEEEKALERRHAAEFIQRPPQKPERPRVRFVHGPGLVGFAPRAVTGMAPGTYVNNSWAMPQSAAGVPRRTTPVNRERNSRSLGIGPFKIPIPDGFRLLPGGGFELALPAEGETVVSGPLGSYTIPFTAPGITIRRR